MRLKTVKFKIKLFPSYLGEKVDKGQFGFCFLKLLLRIVFENIEKIILVFFENCFCYLNLVFSVYFVFFITKLYDPRNSNFWKNGKIVISITKLSFRLKICNLFSRYRMKKCIKPLESSREI